MITKPEGVPICEIMRSAFTSDPIIKSMRSIGPAGNMEGDISNFKSFLVAFVINSCCNFYENYI